MRLHRKENKHPPYVQAEDDRTKFSSCPLSTIPDRAQKRGQDLNSHACQHDRLYRSVYQFLLPLPHFRAEHRVIEPLRYQMHASVSAYCAHCIFNALRSRHFTVQSQISSRWWQHSHDRRKEVIILSVIICNNSHFLFLTTTRRAI